MSKPLQLTLGLLKPDIFANPVFLDLALARIRAQSHMRIRQATIVQWSPEQAADFYAEHHGKFFYQRLCDYMLSGPFQALVLEGPEVIRDWRALIGPTHPIRARIRQPHTLRAEFGLTDTRNSFHGSDSPANARHEIRKFFPDFIFPKDLE
ncbi:nucleoside diphosphate kinase [Dimargaris cristalligena]|uniref:Nucleoside diphosphate kinase n=1 Tax=Dimargaris cristalligena TaxID=215637 RepID=A0A4P9ZYU9_9FUNG|nr:nucleoside diphosphate kinase [Dimargaris cristalligena]|eukprot:RKP38935.1 nucleoside diphosphate kinase [Dimargaris cristalligena]